MFNISRSKKVGFLDAQKALWKNGLISSNHTGSNRNWFKCWTAECASPLNVFHMTLLAKVTLEIAGDLVWLQAYCEP